MSRPPQQRNEHVADDGDTVLPCTPPLFYRIASKVFWLGEVGALEAKGYGGIQGAGHQADDVTAARAKSLAAISSATGRTTWALPAEKVRGLNKQRDEIWRGERLIGSAADIPSAREDRDFVLFCFAKPEDTEAFPERFSGTPVA